MLLILALVMLTLSPLADQVGAAQVDGDDSQAQETQEAEQPAPPTDEIVEETEEPPATEEAVETEEVEETEQATEDVEETPEGEQVGAIEVEYRECPADYDISGTDPDTVLMECDQADGVAFSVTTSDGNTTSQQTGEFGDSHVSFTELPTGMTAITQANPPGDLSVTCEGIVQHGGPETGVMSLSVSNGSVQWNLLDDEIVFCDWFVTSGAVDRADSTPDNEQVGSVNVNYWECAADYDLIAADTDALDADCTESPDGVPFRISNANGEIETQDTGDINDGVVAFAEVPAGDVTVAQVIPPAALRVFCEGIVSHGGPETGLMELAATAGAVDWNLLDDEVVYCDWYAPAPLEGAADGNTVTVYKWICPEGTVHDQEQTWYETNCTQYSDDFTFMLTTTAGTSATTPNTGQYQWTDVPQGPIGIQETIPPAYGAPVVYCGASTTEGDETPEILAGTYERYDAPTGYVSHEIPDPSGYNFYCQWFNIPGGPGEITIYKWTCPEGYDLYAYGADPKTDCPEATNGVTFFLDVPDPADTDLQTDTGDSIEGAVYFGGLDPGAYTVTEEVPADTGYVFVLECDGLRDGMVRPYPLSMGDTLTIDLAAGDTVVCHWFNVPGYDPDYGRVTVTKYWCTTPAYVSEVDCQIYEEGITFDLLVADGAGWDVYDTKTTDGAGKIIWQNLEPGSYWLDEKDQNWCALYASTMKSGKESFAVNENEETIVKVYNCEIETPPSGKKPPAKYPNTGVGPSDDGSGSDPVALPSFAPLLGLVVITLRRLRAASLTGRRWSTGGRGWLASGLAIVPLVALLAIGPAIAQDSDDDDDAGATPDLELCLPDDGTSESRSSEGDGNGAGDSEDQNDETSVEDDPNIAIATEDGSLTGPEGSHDDTDACVRGEVPARIEIEAIGVDAGIEILETVGGEMQQPTDAERATWYKESARIGETGNIVIAGHLNWWNVPEAVFGRIATLQPGDTIVLTGEDGAEMMYEVERVTQEDAFAEPAAEVIGNAAEPTLTLITCGGEWDATESLYNERTVVRAVPATETEDAAGN